MQTLNIIISYLGILLWAFGLYLAFFSHLRTLIGRAVVIIWKKKYLWLLGFFAGLTAYGGEVNFFFQRFDTVASIRGVLHGIRDAITTGQVDQFAAKTKALWSNNAGQLSSYSIVTLIILAIIIWLIIMSQGAMVRIVGRYQQGKPTGLTDGLGMGTVKFWTLIQLNLMGLLFGLASWVILTAVPAAIFLLTNNGAWSVVAYVGSLAAIIVSSVIIFLVQFATAGIVLNDANLIPAIVDAWRLFANNILASIEMAIAVFTTNVTVSFLVIAQLFFFMSNSVFTVQGFLWVVAIIVVLYSLLSAFSFSAWTIFYTKLVEGKTSSKLNQWTTQLASFASQKKGIS